MSQQHFIYLAIVLVAAILFLVPRKLKGSKTPMHTNTKRPPENAFPTEKVVNDKLVIIEDANEEDIQKILEGFCNSYNNEAYQAILRLTKLADKKFAVTFPYDINFEIYCYFINYVNYPMGFNKKFKAIGWTTTKPSDIWTTEKSVNKHVMLFISDFDKEYDNVFLTTSDNIGYKLGFAIGEAKQALNRPEKNYIKPPVNMEQLDTDSSPEFK
ncbi:hypothetical protein LJB85_02335 [Porphyromonadaceae bacterium OttesenSCG-928-L07]|nr:hypothetical protein [Porphyromonadaceae bacterium OttesenSCG-928-L07]